MATTSHNIDSTSSGTNTNPSSEGVVLAPNSFIGSLTPVAPGSRGGVPAVLFFCQCVVADRDFGHILSKKAVELKQSIAAEQLSRAADGVATKRVHDINCHCMRCAPASMSEHHGLMSDLFDYIFGESSADVRAPRGLYPPLPHLARAWQDWSLTNAGAHALNGNQASRYANSGFGPITGFPSPTPRIETDDETTDDEDVYVASTTKDTSGKKMHFMTIDTKKWNRDFVQQLDDMQFAAYAPCLALSSNGWKAITKYPLSTTPVVSEGSVLKMDLNMKKFFHEFGETDRVKLVGETASNAHSGRYSNDDYTVVIRVGSVMACNLVPVRYDVMKGHTIVAKFLRYRRSIRKKIGFIDTNSNVIPQTDMVVQQDIPTQQTLPPVGSHKAAERALWKLLPFLSLDHATALRLLLIRAGVEQDPGPSPEARLAELHGMLRLWGLAQQDRLHPVPDAQIDNLYDAHDLWVDPVQRRLIEEYFRLNFRQVMDNFNHFVSELYINQYGTNTEAIVAAANIDQQDVYDVAVTLRDRELAQADSEWVDPATTNQGMHSTNGNTSIEDDMMEEIMNGGYSITFGDGQPTFVSSSPDEKFSTQLLQLPPMTEAQPVKLVSSEPVKGMVVTEIMIPTQNVFEVLADMVDMDLQSLDEKEAGSLLDMIEKEKMSNTEEWITRHNARYTNKVQTLASNGAKTSVGGHFQEDFVVASITSNLRKYLSTRMGTGVLGDADYVQALTEIKGMQDEAVEKLHKPRVGEARPAESDKVKSKTQTQEEKEAKRLLRGVDAHKRAIKTALAKVQKSDFVASTEEKVASAIYTAYIHHASPDEWRAVYRVITTIPFNGKQARFSAIEAFVQFMAEEASFGKFLSASWIVASDSLRRWFVDVAYWDWARSNVMEEFESQSGFANWQLTNRGMHATNGNIDAIMHDIGLTYGNFGGQSYSGGQFDRENFNDSKQPVDGLDNAFRNHDVAYTAAKTSDDIREADQALRHDFDVLRAAGDSSWALPLFDAAFALKTFLHDKGITLGFSFGVGNKEAHRMHGNMEQKIGDGTVATTKVPIESVSELKGEDMNKNGNVNVDEQGEVIGHGDAQLPMTPITTKQVYAAAKAWCRSLLTGTLKMPTLQTSLDARQLCFQRGVRFNNHENYFAMDRDNSLTTMSQPLNMRGYNWMAGVVVNHNDVMIRNTLVQALPSMPVATNWKITQTLQSAINLTSGSTVPSDIKALMSLNTQQLSTDIYLGTGRTYGQVAATLTFHSGLLVFRLLQRIFADIYNVTDTTKFMTDTYCDATIQPNMAREAVYWPATPNEAVLIPAIDARMCTLTEFIMTNNANKYTFADGWRPADWGTTCAVVPIFDDWLHAGIDNAKWTTLFMPIFRKNSYTLPTNYYNNIAHNNVVQNNVWYNNLQLVQTTGPKQRVLFVLMISGVGAPGMQQTLQLGNAIVLGADVNWAYNYSVVVQNPVNIAATINQVYDLQNYGDSLIESRTIWKRWADCYGDKEGFHTGVGLAMALLHKAKIAPHRMHNTANTIFNQLRGATDLNIWDAQGIWTNVNQDDYVQQFTTVDLACGVPANVLDNAPYSIFFKPFEAVLLASSCFHPATSIEKTIDISTTVSGMIASGPAWMLVGDLEHQFARVPVSMVFDNNLQTTNLESRKLWENVWSIRRHFLRRNYGLQIVRNESVIPGAAYASWQQLPFVREDIVAFAPSWYSTNLPSMRFKTKELKPEQDIVGGNHYAIFNMPTSDETFIAFQQFIARAPLAAVYLDALISRNGALVDAVMYVHAQLYFQQIDRYLTLANVGFVASGTRNGAWVRPILAQKYPFYWTGQTIRNYQYGVRTAGMLGFGSIDTINNEVISMDAEGDYGYATITQSVVADPSFKIESLDE